MNKLIDLINFSAEKASKERKEYKVHGTNIFIKDSLPENIDIRSIINQIESLIPIFLFESIDVIYIGQFNEFIERDINAFYSDGALYITNDQTDDKDIIDDIVHEISHSIEEVYGMEIYGDGKIESEFIVKRSTIERILKHNGFKTSKYDFLNTEYSKDLDSFFYEEVGYPMLNNLVNGLFASAYGVTSIREYYANGFEEYYLGDRKYLFDVSPKLYEKIEFLEEGE